MRIFHGSDHVIESPTYGAGKPYNDYGRGFYCTESLEMAQEWSASPNKATGFANAYDLDLSNLTVLDLNKNPYGILHWMAVLLEHRSFAVHNPLEVQAKDYLISNYSPPCHEHDIIVGNRADDSYFSFARAFLGGSLSLQQLASAMKLGRLGTQIVLKSERAFQQVSFVEAVESSTRLWLPRRQNRDAKARNDYLRLAQSGFDTKGIYIQDILREEMAPDDPRIQ